jgi:hypothetical protein
MPLVEQERLTLPEHMSSPRVVSGVRVSRSLVLCVCFVNRCLFFCPFSWAIVLSVLLRITDSDYHIGIFKFFLFQYVYKNNLFLYDLLKMSCWAIFVGFSIY